MQTTSYEATVTDCDITKVVLFKSGLAYYEREASVPAGESCINLVFNEDEVHQVVSTLIVDDPEGGVKSVTFGKPKGTGRRRLIGEENKGFEHLLLELRGARIKCSFENKETTEGLCLGTEKKWQNTSDGKSIETTWISIFDTASNSLKHVEMRWVTDIDILDRHVAQELQDALRNELTYRTEETHVKTQDVVIHLEGKEPRKVKISCVHTVGPWYIEYRLTTNPVRLDAWVVLQNPRHSFHNATLWAVSENLNVSIGPDPSALAEHCLKSAQPVTVVKNSPALIPLSRFNVEAKIVCLYDSKAANKNVVLAVLLKNKSKLPTEKGNVTIFQNGLYLGNSVINVCRPGDDQFLQFANADFMKLSSSAWSKVTYPTHLYLANRSLTVKRKKMITTNYYLSGLMLDKPMDLYVLHPMPWASELFHEENLIQIKDSVGIFKTVLEPTKKPVGTMTALKVEEKTTDSTSFSLNNLTRAIANKWLSGKLINQQVYDALEELISLNEKMDAHAKLMDQKIKEMDDTLEDGKRIIGNIGLVSEQLKEDSELRNKWMNQLLTHEEKYQEGRVQMREMLQKASDYERQVEELLSNLKLDVDLGDQIEDDLSAHQFAALPGFGFGQNNTQQGVFAKHKHYAQSLADNFGVALQSRTNAFGGNNTTGFGSQTTSTQPSFSFGSGSSGFGGATFAFGGSSSGPSTFGSSSAPSGTTSLFGSTGSTSTGFGSTSAPTSTFGSSSGSTSSTTSGFGTTSSTTGTTSATSTPAFGSSTTTSTFGSAPTTTSSFGSTTPATSSFGTTPAVAPSTGFTSAPPQSPFTFGGTSSQPSTSAPSGFSFGGTSSQPSTTAPSGFSFGSTSSQPTTSSSFSFGTSSGPSAQPTQPSSFSFGTSSAQPTTFQPTTVNENNQTVQLQHISAMPQYQNLSPEEIRVKQQQQDQLNNGGVFGQPKPQ